MKTLPVSTATQKLAVGQETEYSQLRRVDVVGRRPRAAVVGEDVAARVHRGAEDADGHETEVRLPPGSMLSGDDHELPS